MNPFDLQPPDLSLYAMHPSLYYSYLLRLWRDDKTSPWRIQLEDPHTGERHGFPNMEKLIEFLDRRIEEALAQDDSTGSG